MHEITKHVIEIKNGNEIEINNGHDITVEIAK
jgi:hypothetical protein